MEPERRTGAALRAEAAAPSRWTASEGPCEVEDDASVLHDLEHGFVLAG